MLYTQDRNRMRGYFFEVWRKHRLGSALDPLEAIVAEIMVQHPEYHAMLDYPGANLDRDYPPEFGETNPFLHLSLHIALREQITTNRPRGIGEIYKNLTSRAGDGHETAHRMIECLAEMIWTAQRNGVAPEETIYLDCLRKLL